MCASSPLLSQLQSYRLNDFYRFIHEPVITTFEALNNDLETPLAQMIDTIDLTIDLKNSNLNLNHIGRNNEDFQVLKVEKLSEYTTLYVVNDGTKITTFTISQNTPQEKIVLCVWMNDEGKYQGWQSVVIE